MGKAKTLSDSKVVSTSLAVSVSDVVLNFIVALITGSTVMFSQALQGLSDVTTAGFLYLGVNHARRKPDAGHPFGYGRELFFWVLIAAFFMFIGTGGLSIYFGWQQLMRPQPVDQLWLGFSMLTLGFITNAYALSRSFIRLSHGSGRLTWRGFRHSGMIETKTTFLVDTMGSAAALIGLVSLVIFLLTGDARFDGLGAVVIGLSTMTAAIFIMGEVRELITGRSVSPEIAEQIRRSALSVTGVRAVLDLRTMNIGATKLLVILEVHLEDELNTDHIERIIDNVKTAVRETVPTAHRIQVEVETPDDELSYL